ncbi:MAG: Holliday junction branch migration protein RuvA, partial [Erysipelotrichaceae bacterium]
LFIKLISVKGLGPKIASNMLAKESVGKIVSAIENNDVAFMKKMPGIGAKTASQIILDLKGKLVETGVEEKHDPKLDDVYDALKALGYKANEINPVMKKIKEENLSTDEYIKKALGLLLKQR